MPAISRLIGPNPVTRLDAYVSEFDGGHALVAAHQCDPRSIIEIVNHSGLRGRGGAGFPTGRKWSTVADNPHGTPTVVVNAAEGEPGTFKDRALLRSNPYSVLEGACIAALAVGATEIVVATKASFSSEIERIRHAIDEVTAAGWLEGGTLRVAEGPGEYLLGEETALLEVIEGRPPFPRVVPPYRRGLDTGAAAGRLDDWPPTLVDNVETLANVPGILRHGPDWFRSVGTEQSPGTIICTVTGEIGVHGIGEFTLGTPLREVLDTIGEGVPDDVAAVLIGVSSPPLTGDQLDVCLTYEHLASAGSGLGSAGFIVIDGGTSLHDVAAGVARFLSIESCGQCQPCKHDGLDIAAALEDGSDDAVRERLTTVARGARCALAGQTERVVSRLLEIADSRPTRPTGTAWPIVPMVDIVGGRAVLDRSHLLKRPDWSFEGDHHDSHLDPVQRYAGRPVVIRPAHTPEATPLPTRARVPTTPGAEHAAFAALDRSQAQIERTLASLREANVDARPALVAQLAAELERHRDATERFIFPALEHIDPDIGADITWYPIHHDHHARRLLERIAGLDAPISPALIDDLCAAIHVSVIETDRRVLPLLERDLDQRRIRALEADTEAILERRPA